jgi:predicted dienelactone hydrolase
MVYQSGAEMTRRSGRLAIAAAVLAVVTHVACTSGGDVGGSAITSTASDSTEATPVDYAVGKRRIDLVDRSRPTAADPGRNRAERSDRTIRVTLLYPAEGASEANPGPVEDAPVADGGFALVVFSHGWTVSGDFGAYQQRLEVWAGAGYVVAAPTFPLTSGPGAGPGDYVNQPGDVSFVIDELLADASQPGDPLYRHIDDDRVGVAGHSLGAVTTIGVTYNSCCHDPRIDAAVEISGVEWPFPNGEYREWPDVPLLAVHGAQDDILPVTGSDQLIAKALPPTYYLRFDRADHTSLLGGREAALMDETVTAFFDCYLDDNQDPLTELPDQIDESGLATFDVRTTNP